MCLWMRILWELFEIREGQGVFLAMKAGISLKYQGCETHSFIYSVYSGIKWKRPLFPYFQFVSSTLSVH